MFDIPNMSKSLEFNKTNKPDPILRILSNLDESVSNSDATTAPTINSCPKCGATWDTKEYPEGTQAMCPVCCSALADPSQSGAGDAAVTSEDSIDADTAKLESTLLEYIELVDSGNIDEASQLLASEQATLSVENAGEGAHNMLLEKFVIKVDANGKKSKVKVRTRKMKRTAAQKRALAKARKRSNNGVAKRNRKKAMKARARMGLNESIRKAQIVSAVQGILAGRSANISESLLRRTINDAYHMNESVVELPADKAQTVLENVLIDSGLGVVDTISSLEEGVLIVTVTVKDSDAEIYLGDVADKVADQLDNYDVDYDEPEPSDDADDEFDITFYFVPQVVNESYLNVANPVVQQLEAATDVVESSKIMTESYAGNSDNVRCKLSPAFIKPGQIIYDADDNTVFEALDESVAQDDGYELSIAVRNSNNPQLAGLAEGARVTLSSKGNYYLLKSDPAK